MVVNTWFTTPNTQVKRMFSLFLVFIILLQTVGFGNVYIIGSMIRVEAICLYIFADNGCIVRFCCVRRQFVNILDNWQHVAFNVSLIEFILSFMKCVINA